MQTTCFLVVWDHWSYSESVGKRVPLKPLLRVGRGVSEGPGMSIVAKTNIVSPWFQRIFFRIYLIFTAAYSVQCDGRKIILRASSKRR